MDKKLKSAILGGSFNPVHLGHIYLAKEVLSLGYSQIIFVPAFAPPHKQKIVDVGADERLHMLRLATSKYHWATVWDGEIRRGGISFTIDTVRSLLKDKIVRGKPGLIIGEDWIADFYTWKEVDEIADTCEIILARRNIGGIRNNSHCEKFRSNMVMLNNVIWPFSSTRVRHTVACGGNFSEMLPAEVALHIMGNGIYGYSK